MTGFKSGSAGDPFGGGDDDSDDTEDDSSKIEVGEDPDTSSTAADVQSPSESSTARDGDRDEGSGSSSSGLPWIYKRDSITDDRTTYQLHLQDTSTDREREGKTDVETALGEPVKKADLREAALLVGLEHIDEVADQLREWGYDFE